MEQWTGEKVTCDICTHIWTAVYEINCDRLECPNCGYMATFECEDL